MRADTQRVVRIANRVTKLARFSSCDERCPEAGAGYVAPNAPCLRYFETCVPHDTYQMWSLILEELGRRQDRLRAP